VPVPLTWLLDQDELALQLVVGDPCDVRVDWAHATELLDPREFLDGGELVLTTGLRMPRARAGQAAYVDRLVEAGVAALGFGTGVRFDRVPDAIVAHCGTVGLALVEVPLPTPFIALSRAVAARIAKERRAGVERLVGLQQALTRATVRDGMVGLVQRLGREVGGVVALDERGSVIEAQAPDPLVARVRLHVAELAAGPGRARQGATVVPEAGVGPGRVVEVHALTGRAARRGWLAVEWPDPPDPEARLLLNHAVSLATLHLDRPHEVEQARGELGALVLALLLGGSPADPAVLAQAGHFAFAPDEPVRVACIDGRGAPDVAPLVRRRLSERGMPHLVLSGQADTLVLVRDADAAQAADELQRALSSDGSDDLVIGLSGAVGLGLAATAAGPARRTAQSARRQRSAVAWFDRLPLEGMLADPVVRARIHDLAVSVLAPLHLEEGDRGRRLVRSLEAFLHHNGSWESAARDLGVHRHTLRNRLEAVERLTGLRLDVAQNRVLLFLALASLDDKDR
jgi:purine catabolism regulator